VHGAVRRIDGRELLAGASLHVRPGSIVGLLGPNGAGKTSLLRAIAGRLRLDAGEVRIAGAAPADARREGRLGVVPQDIALFAHLTVEENLAVLGRLAGVPSASLRARVRDGLEWAGLAERAGAIVTTLSGGMRRRVNLVAGTLHQPALLLLDEPTVGVDADARVRLHDLLGSLRARGMGVLIATHDVDEASVLCDEVAVMAGGRVLTQAPVAQLVRDAFGGERELSLIIEPPVSASSEALLRQQQFRSAGAGRWVRRGGSASSLDLLQQQLLEAGTRVVETRVSEPQLAGAVARLLAQHAGQHAA
jgi:ABC-2 type transport system ATP-binding protein